MLAPVLMPKPKSLNNSLINKYYKTNLTSRQKRFKFTAGFTHNRAGKPAAKANIRVAVPPKERGISCKGNVVKVYLARKETCFQVFKVSV